MAETAVYVYCVVKAPKRPSLRSVPSGLPGAGGTRAVELGAGLWVIAADVPLAMYGPGRLDAMLADMQWVGEAALAHEAVVEHIASLKDVTVVPMKLFTMFSTVDRAIADTRERRGDIVDAVKRIAGCEEWGVRIVRAPGAAHPAERPRAATGAAFLAAKKRARDESTASARAAADAALAAYHTLSALSRDARRRDDVPNSATVPPLLDAAFLVPAGRRARFKSAARRAAESCAEAGASLTVSGPWPAYNFVQPPEVRR